MGVIGNEVTYIQKVVLKEGYMIEVTASWVIIFLAAVVYGTFILDVGNYRETAIYRWDSIIVTGLVFLTWYAQVFSIFYKVGVMSQFILVCGGTGIILIWLINRKKGRIRLFRGLTYWKTFIIFVLILATAAWTCMPTESYDTSLYHAQAIQWIEKYGVVCGLGNLHNRLAYNSAFMCIQALL